MVVVDWCTRTRTPNKQNYVMEKKESKQSSKKDGAEEVAHREALRSNKSTNNHQKHQQH
jgi:hypothetical protein